MNRRSTFARALVDVLVLLLALPVFMKPEMNPAVALVLGSLGAIVLSVTAVLKGRRSVGRPTSLAFGAAAVFAVWIVVAALRSADPLVSFMGTLSQHTGAALWLVVLAWVVAATLLAERRTLRQLLAVTSVAGAVYAALGVWEALTSGDRGWGSAAGPFENSSSLGAFLIVSLLACLGWWFAGRSATVRYAAAGCAAVTIAGLAAAESRAGVAGVVVGAGMVALLALPRVPAGVRRALPFALPAAGIAMTGLLVASATGSLGATMLRAVQALGTSRDAIWRSAVAQFAQSPILGSGPEQFSAWVRWSFDQGMLQYNGTYDPHNVIAGIAVGGGVVGLVLFAIAAWALTAALIAAFERTGRPRVLAAIIAMPAALVAGALFAWLTPLAAIVAAALLGTVLASAEPSLDSEPAGVAADDDSTEPDGRPLRGVVRMAAAALAVSLLVPMVAGLPMLTAELRYVTAGDTATPTTLADLYDTWPDPSFASVAVDRAFATGGDSAAMRALLAVPEERVAEHVDLALLDIFLAQEALAGNEDAWPTFASAIETGVHADPASPLWYTVAAAQADGMGRDDDRERYARAALKLRPGAVERAYLEELLAK